MLADPRFTVDPVPRPPATPDAPTVAWLRGAVGRFAEGAEHAARRAAGEAVLAGLDPGTLRAEAFRLASREGGSLPCPVELIPVLVLAVALGVPAEEGPRAVEAVAAIAPLYLPAPGADSGGYGGDGYGYGGTAAREAADAGMALLARLLGDPAPERLAVLAGLLAQACGATAGLVRGALAAGRAAVPAASAPPAFPAASCLPEPSALRAPSAPPAPERPAVNAMDAMDAVEDLLARTLRDDPPVRVLRRRAPDGRDVVLDIAAANRDPRAFPEPGRAPADEHGHLTFGAGPRACPARRVALALAAGTVEAVLR